jgi:hypothetical protein
VVYAMLKEQRAIWLPPSAAKDIGQSLEQKE